MLCSLNMYQQFYSSINDPLFQTSILINNQYQKYYTAATYCLGFLLLNRHREIAGPSFVLPFELHQSVTLVFLVSAGNSSILHVWQSCQASFSSRLDSSFSRHLVACKYGNLEAFVISLCVLLLIFETLSCSHWKNWQFFLSLHAEHA